MNTGNRNTLACFLKLLNVKFTNSYVDRVYSENPHKDSLSGMAKMLSDYSIENTGVRLHDKNEIHHLETPFLVDIDNNIAIIHKLTHKHVYFKWRERDIVAPIEEFKNIWNGVALVAEKTEETKEPEYKENLKKELFQIIRNYAAMLSIVTLFGIGIITNKLYAHPEALLLLLPNFVGAYIGYLLIQKQLHIPNNHANKLCSLSKNGGCNDVLNSPAAKLFGIIGWSEVGFSYFTSNILITVLFPQLITYLALINLCALPYSFWSVWYQRFKAKQWCPLCLIVQILLWVVFIINFLFGFIAMPEFVVTDILFTGIIYAIPFLIISLILPMFINEKRLQWTTDEMNYLKMKPEVFEALLKQQPHYEVGRSTSQIVWGNPNAETLLTIVTNPHCTPCGMMHKKIEKLLKKTGNNICVQYIFLSFGEDLESSNIFLTEVYLSNEIEVDKKKEIYNEWFENGKYEREDFFNKYKFMADCQTVETEINKHKEWTERNNIHATPTILINGYELPDNYRVEDVIYFLGLKI